MLLKFKTKMTAQEKYDLYMKTYLDRKDEFDKTVEENVEKYRKGDCKLRFVDRDGKPLSNKKVKLTQKTHDFKHGANIFMLDEFEKEEDNKEYRRFFKEYFNLATVPFYWDTLEPEEGNPRYARDSKKVYRRPAPDLCVEYCEENGILPKLHCMVYENHLPEWAAKLSADDLKKRYEQRFQEIANRYKGKMWEFEVINEVQFQHWGSPLSDQKDIVEWAFGLAHKYLDGEKLVINDAGSSLVQIGTPWGRPHISWRSAFMLYIENLILKGVKFDKIGIQNHQFTGVSAKSDEQYEATLKGEVEQNNPFKIMAGLDKLASFNLPIEITEVTIPTFGETEEDEELQAQMLKVRFSAWFAHPAVDAVVYWNTVDGHAYTGNANWVENNCLGGLFHQDLTPKKSALMLKKLFSEIWHTDLELVTDENGCVDFRGFYGDYTAQLDNSEMCFGIHKNETDNFELTV